MFGGSRLVVVMWLIFNSVMMVVVMVVFLFDFIE